MPGFDGRGPRNGLGAGTGGRFGMCGLGIKQGLSRFQLRPLDPRLLKKRLAEIEAEAKDIRERLSGLEG